MKNINSNKNNDLVLKYLARGKRKVAPVYESPDTAENPYVRQGAHPDIVMRIWDEIGKSLPTDCRCLIYGTPALIHHKTGTIMAIAIGTQYGLLLSTESIQKARKAGARTHTKWSDGTDMNIDQALGQNWFFGGWFSDEVTWCVDIYDELEQTT